MGCCGSTPDAAASTGPGKKYGSGAGRGGGGGTAGDAKGEGGASVPRVGSNIRVTHAPPPLDDEQARLVLAQGAEVVMLPRRGKGKAHGRFLYLEALDGDGPRLRWSRGPGTKPVADSVHLGHVTDLVDGQHTAVFAKHAKRYAAAAASSWSLVCDDGSSLDVVMGSVVKKQLWLLALRAELEREAPTYFPSTVVVSMRNAGGDEEHKAGAAGDAESKTGTGAAKEDAARAATTGDGRAAAIGSGARAAALSNASGGSSASAVAAAKAKQAEAKRVAAEAARRHEEHEARKAAAVGKTSQLLRDLLRDVKDQLGSSGDYTGAEVMAVVRAAAAKRAAAVTAAANAAKSRPGARP